MKKYRCSICGQIVEVEEGQNCPMCGSPFELLEEVKEETVKEYKKIEGPIPISDYNPSIERIEEKCIKCGLCSKICQDKVGIKYNLEKALNPVCLNCGQCISNCPTGAIVPKYCYKKIMDYIKDTTKTVVVYTSPAVRVAIGDEFDFAPGENLEKKLVSALKQIGFNYVFDTTFGADLTIMEEASELIERIKAKKNLPQFTSCCPSWVKYTEIYHKELLDNLSTCKSPVGMQGSMIKNYFASMKQIPKEDIITVAITPCTAKKAEIKREEIKDNDYVITTTELAMMIRELDIDFKSLNDEEYDSIMGRGSGAGVIFGNSGGVSEAALRAVYKFITNNNPPTNFLEYNEVRGFENIKESILKINDIDIKLLVVHGMKNIEEIISSGDYKKYDFIEVMNCPGGCVGGGGQPLKVISKQKEILEERIKGLYKEDQKLNIRCCYDNKDIIDIYNSFLDYPLSQKSKELLHTTYNDKSSVLGE